MFYVYKKKPILSQIVQNYFTFLNKLETAHKILTLWDRKKIKIGFCVSETFILNLKRCLSFSSVILTFYINWSLSMKLQISVI